MNKFLIRIIGCIILIGIIFSQEPENHSSDIKMGIGFEFQTIGPLVMALTNADASFGYMYIPMTTKKFMIEPLIGYTYNLNYVDSPFVDANEEYESSLIIAIGLFLRTHKTEKLKSYAGARIGRITENERDVASWDLSQVTEYKTEGFFVAPTIGAEYFISDYFSFGGDFSLRMASGKRYNEDDELVDKMKTTILVPNLILRFYF